MATVKLEIFARRRLVTVTCSVLTSYGPLAGLAGAVQLRSSGARELSPGPASLQTILPSLKGAPLVRQIRLG